MAFIISLSNGKGGVAKTTTCIALGGSLSEMGYRVLLIDLDPNANLTLGFGSLSEKAVEFSKDLFLPNRSHPIRCVKTGYPNLDLIPSDGDLALLDSRLSSGNNSKLLQHSLNALDPDSYDFVLIDCPATLGTTTFNALVASHLLIIPTQSEFFSAYALQTMFSVIGDIRRDKNPNLKYRILITLLDLHQRDHNNILNQLQRHIGESLYKTKIFIDPLLRDSQIQGIPITFSGPNSTCALQYRRLAQEIINDLIADDHRDKSSVSLVANKNTPVQFDQNVPVPSMTDLGDTGFPKINLDTSMNRPSDQSAAPGRNLPVNSASDRQAPSQDHAHSFCPHLGGIEDPQTMLAYPSTWNKCHLTKHIVSPGLEHQIKFCISKNFSACPLLKEQAQKLRSPSDKSEMLQYIKNLIRAKSFD